MDQSASDGTEHYGLGILKERAGSVGAKLNIVSTPGEGTEVRVTLPKRGRVR